MKSLLLFNAMYILLSCGNTTTKSTDNIGDTATKLNTENMVMNTDTTFSFEESAEGDLPKDWVAPTGKWTIVTDENNKVLKQSASNSGSTFNICVNGKLIYQDLQLEVKLKAASGKEDQGGGLVWRYTDKNNYYIVRSNPLEKNVVLYKVENGKRKDLPLVGKGRTYGMDAPMETAKWHTLKVIIQKNMFTVLFDGKELFQVKDDTFKEGGLVGVWTKADAQTYFDELMIQSLK
ncbi:MAG TPA: hypothetical protein PKL37_22510 [Panacibacter sp.]|nr:hypothetical protein [Panacibacter sp.]